MKLTKKLEAEVLKAYKAYWDAYFNGDMKTFASFLDDNIWVFGTAISEVFNNKKKMLRFYKATAEQLVGKAELRNRRINVQAINDSVLINEQSDLYILMEEKWTFYGNARASAILKHTRSGWKLVHQHGSFPDTRAEEGEQVAAEKIKAENIQLRDAVKRRTIELEEKNRELEIETAVERVRATTNAMHRSEDLHKVIREVYDQLRLLEFRFDGVDFMTDYSDKGFNIWLAAQQHTFSAPIYVPSFGHKIFRLLKKVKKEEKDFFTFTLDREEKNKYVKHLIENTIVKNVPEKMKQHMLAAKGWTTSCVVLENIILSITNLELIPYTDAENAIIKRFAHVFQQSYTRFLDLQKSRSTGKRRADRSGIGKSESYKYGYAP